MLIVIYILLIWYWCRASTSTLGVGGFGGSCCESLHLCRIMTVQDIKLCCLQQNRLSPSLISYTSEKAALSSAMKQRQLYLSPQWKWATPFLFKQEYITVEMSQAKEQPHKTRAVKPGSHNSDEWSITVWGMLSEKYNAKLKTTNKIVYATNLTQHHWPPLTCWV